jgi:aspartyl-tRNA(Asn)/glutamyl-tRNA(Gln) amidotransferase subunit A
VPRKYFFDHPDIDPRVLEVAEQAIRTLASAGASVHDVSLPRAAVARNAQRVIMLGEAYTYHLPDLQRRPELYGKYTRRQLTEGALYSAADYVQAQRMRSVVKRDVMTLMSEVDVLVTPTTPIVAPGFDEDPEAMRRIPSLMSIWNLTGQPAISVCCGFSSQGLPIGLQIAGRPFDEATVLRVADAYQSITDWHTREPAAEREAQRA